MSETDTGPPPTSKMELAVTIINGSHIYAKSRIGQETPGFIIYYPHYCDPVKSPALAIIFSLIYLSS